MVGVIAGYLVDVSFSLPQQKTIVLDRARTVIDLATELFPNITSYDELDSKVDELINFNDIVGEQIYELPKGRSIVYFV